MFSILVEFSVLSLDSATQLCSYCTINKSEFISREYYKSHHAPRLPTVNSDAIFSVLIVKHFHAIHGEQKKQTWNSKAAPVHSVKLNSKVWNGLKLITTEMEGRGWSRHQQFRDRPRPTTQLARQRPRLGISRQVKCLKMFGNLVKRKSKCIQCSCGVDFPRRYLKISLVDPVKVKLQRVLRKSAQLNELCTKLQHRRIIRGIINMYR